MVHACAKLIGVFLAARALLIIRSYQISCDFYRAHSKKCWVFSTQIWIKGIVHFEINF